MLAVPARAEHEVYYRFTVLGYVKDAQGKPVAGARVEVVRDKTGFSYLGEADEQGFYFVRTRLGDESRGETLTVRQDKTVQRLTVAFDPANQTDERGTRLDFEGARAVERAVWFRSTLLNVVGTTRH
ncbi:MAG TPA: carboxypeptidase-like regulatory domain-containing protein [Methylomirabilota bacterium]|nr:carboxypeptidase-like regulatory domain-containing protein [Methylomirabilota bacterium]